MDDSAGELGADVWRRRLETAAENHLRRRMKETIHRDRPPGSHIPYCSCITCEVREAIAGAWPIIQEMLHANIQSLTTADEPLCENPRVVDGTPAPCGTCPACRRVEL